MSTKFDAFNITDHTYKTVDAHEIVLSILTPKTISPGKYPLLVRFHGGFLVTGNRMHPEWFPQWTLDLALSTPCILLTPDYRLAPESRGTDILADCSALLSWLHTSLPFLLSPLALEADLNHILLTGESAGGYLAVQSALLYAQVPEAKRSLRISAVVSAYGALDLQSAWFTQGGKAEGSMMGHARTPRTRLDEHVAAWQSGVGAKIVSHAAPPEPRGELAVSIVEHGRYLEVLGPEEELLVFSNVGKVKAGDVAPMWVFHGRQDSLVPVEGSERFVEVVAERHPDAEVKLTVVEGEHGVDNQPGVDARTGWVAEGLDWVTEHWLRD